MPPPRRAAAATWSARREQSPRSVSAFPRYPCPRPLTTDPAVFSPRPRPARPHWQ
ncbi:hypothetical protein CALCODRAFT_492189 [Calocera cornea HHB12733]|uniref:Uncharacterized protein n=1 Tax=Calocera cornea HHB12733 TaxID=1353952 RepID=A0A165IJB8_9BASI|nr:hypothetical protein CALCODRAFT_492189 [Calocera cornea HHB12733]